MNNDKQLLSKLSQMRQLAQKPVSNVRQADRRMAKIFAKYCREDIRFFATECINDLKLERWCLMRNRFAWTANDIARLDAANERLKAALLHMRQQAIQAFEAAKEQTPHLDIEVEGTLWVKEMTFELWQHDDDMQEALFDIMASKTYGGFYANSVSAPYRLQHNALVSDTPSTYDSEAQLLYLDHNMDNWNELMPPDKTDKLHLVYAIHNLYEHCRWTIQDIIGIRSYCTEINISRSPRPQSHNHE